MNILIAPNSMKGSLNAFEFSEIIEKALLASGLECSIRKIPVADGGDFTGEILARQLKAKAIHKNVTSPFGRPVKSTYWISEKIAIIEMAEASGMKKVAAEELNPLLASSFGTGELILDAVRNGCSEIWLTIGGSATVDGGMGMMEALGYKFYDKTHQELKGNGQNLLKISQIKKGASFKNIAFKILCDVENPLLGKNGAAAVFAPQKGATPDMIETLERGLNNWQNILASETGRDFAKKGYGAAGGLALPIMAFFNACMEIGAPFVLNLLNFEGHVKWSDIVITGEGKIDHQTNNFKAPYTVAQMAHKIGKPVYAFAGSCDELNHSHFDKIYTLVSESIAEKEAIKNASELIYNRVLEFADDLK